MSLWSRPLNLRKTLKAFQSAVEGTIITARDEFLEQAVKDSKETIPLPGSPTKLAMTPQDQLLPAVVKFETEDVKWLLDEEVVKGTLFIRWELKDAPEMTARLRDQELGLLDNTLDNGGYGRERQQDDGQETTQD